MRRHALVSRGPCRQLRNTLTASRSASPAFAESSAHCPAGRNEGVEQGSRTLSSTGVQPPVRGAWMAAIDAAGALQITWPASATTHLARPRHRPSGPRWRISSAERPASCRATRRVRAAGGGRTIPPGKVLRPGLAALEHAAARGQHPSVTSTWPHRQQPHRPRHRHRHRNRRRYRRNIIATGCAAELSGRRRRQANTEAAGCLRQHQSPAQQAPDMGRYTGRCRTSSWHVAMSVQRLHARSCAVGCKRTGAARRPPPPVGGAGGARTDAEVHCGFTAGTQGRLAGTANARRQLSCHPSVPDAPIAAVSRTWGTSMQDFNNWARRRRGRVAPVGVAVGIPADIIATTSWYPPTPQHLWASSSFEGGSATKSTAQPALGPALVVHHHLALRARASSGCWCQVHTLSCRPARR